MGRARLIVAKQNGPWFESWIKLARGQLGLQKSRREAIAVGGCFPGGIQIAADGRIQMFFALFAIVFLWNCGINIRNFFIYASCGEVADG
ncbi:MAG: hypothetical protein A2X84_04800 [Desulfuromonadaceae bacterium GWC2_58_13]|nr:MAG: hypothetical protein A2X84_04800 [Desulfuromonadaceae bacterium GWC2_58_13]